MELDPTLATGLAAAAPIIAAALTKAQASNRTRSIVSLLVIVGLVAGTYLGDAHPETFAAVSAMVAQMVAISIGAYKLVDTLLGDVSLNDVLGPELGIG